MKETAQRLRETASKEVSPWLSEAEFYVENEEWLLRSARIAAKILVTLKQKGLKQTDLAKMMQTSPQHINKILRGKENLTLETTLKLEKALGISFNEPILTNPNLYGNVLSKPEAVQEINIEIDQKLDTHRVTISFDTAIAISTTSVGSISVKPFAVSTSRPKAKVSCKYKSADSFILRAA